MVYGGYCYLDYSYEPSENDFVVLVWMKGRNRIEKLAEAVAAESSVGTWTSIETMNEKVFREYRARIFKIIKVGENAGFVFIAYPYEHFDEKNLCQLWASIFGNVFGMKELSELYYLDIIIPKKYQKLFKGPRFGLYGIRKYLGTDKSKRPHLGTIVKPKVGLAPSEFSSVAYESWVGGVDLVKDDENLVNQNFCKWRERFDKVFEAKDKAEIETGEKKMYLVNVTDVSIDRMVERIDYIISRGHRELMLDVFVLGFPALMHVLEYTRKYNLIVHAHRAGYAAWHRGNFGINFQILEKFYRLVGVDQLHIGTGVGKMEGGSLLIRRFHEISESYLLKDKFYLGSLEFEFSENINPVMPVASGGLDPTKVEALLVIHGRNVTIQAGGGIHGHPDGTRKGAEAMRIVCEKLMEGYTTKEIAQKYNVVKKAVEKWGYEDPNNYKKILELEKAFKDFLNDLVRREGMRAIREVIWKI